MNKSLSIVITIIAVAAGAVIGSNVVNGVLGHNRLSFDQALVEVSKKINATLPMQVDKETRLDSTVAGPGAVLTYIYTLIDVSSNDLNREKFIGAMKPRLINSYKTNPDMAGFRKQNVELHYHYNDKDGNTLATIVISPKDF